MNLSMQFFLLPFNQFDYQVPFLFSQCKLLPSFHIHKSLSNSRFHNSSKDHVSVKTADPDSLSAYSAREPAR
jgi:hypothetical protein